LARPIDESARLHRGNHVADATEFMMEDGEGRSTESTECQGTPRDGTACHGLARVGLAGSYLIERGLPEAEVQREFKPTGLVCSIEVRLNGTQPNA
jgi:hypothetical protein